MNEIKHIGIAGDGKMGKSIFFYLGGFDFRLTWLVSSADKIEKDRKLFINKTKCHLLSGVFTPADFDAKIGNTVITSNPEDLEECDLVIEAITEDAGKKADFFKLLDRCVNASCIFATNSSSILPSELQPSVIRRERFLGLHFFFPPSIKNMVEVITSQFTSLQTRESLDQFIAKINKTPFYQDETNAFLLNRLFLDFQAGAYLVFLEGRLSFEEIDELVRESIFPIGVFEFFDHVGIDVMLSSVKAYTKNREDKSFYAPLIEKMEELVALNHLGMKTKQGFCSYVPRGEKVVITRIMSDEDLQYNRLVTDRLWGYYINSVNSVIEKGLCSREVIAYAIKDYMGMDSDPLVRQEHS